MDLILILTYTGFCIAIFKVFKIPMNKWTVPTAVLGGVVIIWTLIMLMNYNHPYGKYAKEYFTSVPIVPSVKGIVVSVDAKPNVLLKEGDVLFKIDPKPFEIKVAKKRAQLAEAEQQFKQIEAQLEGAKARVAKAQADRDRAKKSFNRYAKGSKKGAQVFSKQEVENRCELYNAAEAGLGLAKAELQKAQLAFESEIDGDNTKVAQIQSDLDAAKYDLERATVKAPSDGIVTQVALRK